MIHIIETEQVNYITYEVEADSELEAKDKFINNDKGVKHIYTQHVSERFTEVQDREVWENDIDYAWG